MVIYILCPANRVTGGIELVHQMCDAVNTYSNVKAKIWYTDMDNITLDHIVLDIPVPEAYAMYKTEHATDFFEIDRPENIVIFPEGLTMWMPLISEAKKVLWWMSVDNYLDNSEDRGMDFIRDNVDLHLYQSHYSKDFVEKNIPGAKGLFLSDYINDDYINCTIDIGNKKDVAVYNPRKGFEDLKPLIEKVNWLTWTPLQNMDRSQVIDALRTSKIYVDFGNHPGKDRIPREAAASGCCIITNKRGSAAFSGDVPIPEDYKFEDPGNSLDDIDDLMRDICDDFKNHYSRFDNYRDMIKGEKDKFIKDTISFVDYLSSMVRHGKKIIAISHSLNRTGAPLVFYDLVRALTEQGNMVDVIAMEDGPLREEYENSGISLRIADDFLEDLPAWQNIFKEYDAAIVNTLVGIEAIYALNTTTVPTIWWIHEPEYWFQYYQTILPKPEELNANVHVYGVSPITNTLIEKYCGYDTGVFPFGINDLADTVKMYGNIDKETVSFVLPGTISNVKGQDILCEAIKLLPDDIRKQCTFTIFGNKNDGEPEYYESIQAYAEEIDELELKAGIPHDEALAQIAKADYLLAPSRMEPFPTTAVEALMVSTVPIVSSACGVNYYLERNFDSMVFDSENVGDLCQVIVKAVDIRIEQVNEYKRLCTNARKTYEKQFSMIVFSDNIDEILEKALGEKIMRFESEISTGVTDDRYPMIVYDHPEEYASRGLQVLENAAEFCKADSLSKEDLKWLSKDYDVLFFDRNQSIREGYAEIFKDPYYREKLSPKQMVDAICQEENEASEDDLTIEDRLKYLTPDTYKEYEKLGDDLLSANVDQAFLCYENAEYLCDDDNEKERISKKKQELFDTGRVKVKKTAFVILSYNNKYLMQRCIESIYTNCNPESYSLIIFDNNSSDGVAQWLAEWGESNDEAIVALSEENLGFSGGCNAAAAYAPEGEDIFLLNNDTRVPANALFWLRMGLYSSHDVGAAGSIQNYFDSTKDESVNFSVIEKYMEYGAKKNVYTEGALEEQSKLCGFALLIRRNVWEEIGGLDEQFNPGYLEDDDICLGIIKLGYKLMMVHNSFIYHVGSQSFIKRNDLDELYIAHRKLLIEKWGFDNVYYSAVMKEQLEFIDSLSDKGYTRDSSFSVLHINCGCANMLGHIKYLYPNAELVGVEESDIIRKYAVSCIKVYGSVRELPKNVDEYDEVFRSE